MRSRNIKPGFFSNELLGQLDPILSVLFAGLWCLADKSGILEDRPMRIKAEVFPYRMIDAAQFNGYLTELSRLGFIVRYIQDDTPLIHITNFAKHQSPHHTERASQFSLPTAPESAGCDLTVKSPLGDGGNPPDSLIHPFIDSSIQEKKAPSPSRARQSAEKKGILPIPEELLPFLETLTRDWPRRSHDGRRVTILRPKDSWEKICKNRGDDDPKIPVNAALAYLDTNPTQYVIGMDNFFGVARKYTKFVVED